MRIQQQLYIELIKTVSVLRHGSILSNIFNQRELLEVHLVGQNRAVLSPKHPNFKVILGAEVSYACFRKSCDVSYSLGGKNDASCPGYWVDILASFLSK